MAVCVCVCVCVSVVFPLEFQSIVVGLPQFCFVFLVRGQWAGRQKGEESFHGASLSISLGCSVSKRLF